MIVPIQWIHSSQQNLHPQRTRCLCSVIMSEDIVSASICPQFLCSKNLFEFFRLDCMRNNTYPQAVYYIQYMADCTLFFFEDAAGVPLA